MAGVFEVAEEATPPCGYHTAKDTIQVRRWGLQALVVAGLAAAVFALGYGLVELFRAPPPVPPAPKVQLAVEADYRGATVGQAYTVEVVIYNTSDVAVGNIRIEIAKESLEALYLREVRPEPLAWDELPGWRVLAYPQLNAWERRRVALEFVPRRAGSAHLKVRLFSGKDSYHGQCDLPVTVRAAGAAEEAAPSGSHEEEEGR